MEHGLLRSSFHCGVGNALYCLATPKGGADVASWADRRSGSGATAPTAQEHLVAVGCRQRQVQLWDLAAEQRVLSCEGHLKEVGALAMAGENVLVSGSGDATIKVWDARSGTCEATLRGHSSTVMTLALDAAGDRLVSGGVDKTVRTWDLRHLNQPLVQIFEGVHQGAVFAVEFDDDRVISGSADGQISVLNFNWRRH